MSSFFVYGSPITLNAVQAHINTVVVRFRVAGFTVKIHKIYKIQCMYFINCILQIVCILTVKPATLNLTTVFIWA